MKSAAKKLLSVLLASVMMLGILPVTAAALSYSSISIEGDVLSSSSYTLTVPSGDDTYDLRDLDINYPNGYYYYLYYGDKSTKTISEVTSNSDYTDYPFEDHDDRLYITFFDTSTDSESCTISVTFDASGKSTGTSGVTLTDEDFYIVCAASKTHYFEYEDFEDPGYYDYDLDDYDESDVYVYLYSLPTYGTLYVDDVKAVVGDYVYLDDIDDLSYYRDSSSSSKADSFTISLYDNDDGEYLAKKATMYTFTSEPTSAGSSGTAVSFTMEYDEDDDEISFDASDFEDHFIAGEGGDLDYVKIVSTTASKYGTLYLSKDEVDDDDKILYSKIKNLIFECGSSFGEGVSFSWAAIDENGNVSNTATLTFDNEEYAPTLADMTVGTKRDTTVSIPKEYWSWCFSDKNGDPIDTVTILSLPDEDDGVLYMNKAAVSVGDEIDASKLGNMKFTPEDDFVGEASFYWTACDDDGKTPETPALCTVVVSKTVEMSAGTFYVPLNEDDKVIFTAGMFKANFIDPDDDALSTVKITAIPDTGTLYINDDDEVKKNQVLTIAQLNTLVYEPYRSYDPEDGDSFTYAATSGSSYSDKAEVYIMPHDSDDVPNSVKFTLSVDQATNSAVLEYDIAKLDDTLVLSSQISAEDVEFIMDEINFTGGTLTIRMPAESNPTSRTISIDYTMFTTANVRKIASIVFEDNKTNTVRVAVDTESICERYSYNTYPFYITIGRVTLSDTTDSMLAGIARDVSFKMGNTPFTFSKPNAAYISIPYAAASSQTEMAVIFERTGNMSFTPLKSSDFEVTSGTNGYTTACITGSGTFVAGLEAVTFSDVATGHWAYGFVSELSAKSVINGYEDGSFKPENTVTRAEYIKLLISALELTNNAAVCSYTDAAKTDWFYPYVASAVKAGVLTDGGSFEPDKGITRQDMALYSYLAAQAAGIELPTNAAAISFIDADKISSGCSSAVTAMQRAGIINGYTDSSFQPEGTTKRCEASKIISMLLGYMYS